jgi:hypothetical protein
VNCTAFDIASRMRQPIMLQRYTRSRITGIALRKA